MYLNSYFISYSKVQITLERVPRIHIYVCIIKILNHLLDTIQIDEIISYISQSQSIFSLWLKK